MATDSEGNREHGIEFGDLVADLDDESFPLSHDALLDRYGDRELGLFDDQVALDEVLQQEGEQEYEDAESVRQTVLNMVGGEAVGREGYSDRGGTGANGEGESDPESF